MYCRQCGKELKIGAHFCVYCGTPVLVVPKNGDSASLVSDQINAEDKGTYHDNLNDQPDTFSPPVTYTFPSAKHPDMDYQASGDAAPPSPSTPSGAKTGLFACPRRTLIPIVILIAGVIIAFSAVHIAKTRILERAMNTCQHQVDSDIWDLYVNDIKIYSLVDNGKTLSIESSTAADQDILYCIFNQTNIPQSVVKKMESTRALDGTLSDSWDNLYATWNYHPNTGFNLVLEIK